MTAIVETGARIYPMAKAAIEKVRAYEAVAKELPQEDVATWHVLHGGVYTRTIKIKAGILLTGVLVKVPTTVTMSGDVMCYANDECIRFTGYNVVPASANRKQAFMAIEDTMLTMAFATKAKSIEEAEDEFTDEAGQLMSRAEGATNFFNITGE